MFAEAELYNLHTIPLQIIETMSFTAEVSAFMETLGPFYESVEKDEENQTTRQSSNNNCTNQLSLTVTNIDNGCLRNEERKIEASPDNEQEIPPSTKHLSIQDVDNAEKNIERDQTLDSDQENQGLNIRICS